MLYSIIFGVKAKNLDDAERRTAAVLDLKSEKRENAVYGGDYYVFYASQEEKFKLMNNEDEISLEPVYDYPDWPIIMLCEGGAEDSSYLAKLMANNNDFVVLESDRY